MVALFFGIWIYPGRCMKRKKKIKEKRKRYNTNWTGETYLLLKSIVNDKSGLYLDEIQQELFELDEGWWSPSIIFEKLRDYRMAILYK